MQAAGSITPLSPAAWLSMHDLVSTALQMVEFSYANLKMLGEQVLSWLHVADATDAQVAPCCIARSVLCWPARSVLCWPARSVLPPPSPLLLEALLLQPPITSLSVTASAAMTMICV